MVWPILLLKHALGTAAVLSPVPTPVLTPGQAPPVMAKPTGPVGMVWIPAGTFTMGCDDARRPEEGPTHEVRLDGFWMDTHEVTVAQFARFVEATGYQTVAERAIDWDEIKKQIPPGTPKPPDEMLVPGAVVFQQPVAKPPLNDPSRWWRWTPGASWRHPDGPDSDADPSRPVTQVAFEDAQAYAAWADKQLPTEAQWEYAARGGKPGAIFVWGDTPPSDTFTPANIWQGEFPNDNQADDGHVGVAPPASYPANGYGLHDMAGNVWEWCLDWYRGDAYRLRLRENAAGTIVVNPLGPTDSHDPLEPGVPKRVTRGGSFLCHSSYCTAYRVAARRGTAIDTGLSHTGFRCVKNESPPATQRD